MKEKNELPSGVLVHACCAPCATVAAERLAGKTQLVFFFYGPNIHPPEEYRRRLQQMHRLCQMSGLRLIEGPYRPEEWESAIAPYRHLPEGSERCQMCYRLRMTATARLARQEGLPSFTVTLTVSRHKNSRVLAFIGRQVAAAEGVAYLEMDFKKHDGTRRSLQLSRQYRLVRQDYCGCVLSLQEARARRQSRVHR